MPKQKRKLKRIEHENPGSVQTLLDEDGIKIDASIENSNNQNRPTAAGKVADGSQRERVLEWLFVGGRALITRDATVFYGGFTRGVVIGLLLSYSNQALHFIGAHIAKIFV